MSSRLYRSQTDKILGGVCGGLGNYLGIDPIFIRIFFILLTFGDGVGVLIYLFLWIVMPADPTPAGVVEGTVSSGGGEVAAQVRSVGQDLHQAVRTPNPKAGLYVGGALILLGIYFFLRNLNIIWLSWLDFDVLWPVLLIAGGVALLLRRASY